MLAALPLVMTAALSAFAQEGRSAAAAALLAALEAKGRRVADLTEGRRRLLCDPPARPRDGDDDEAPSIEASAWAPLGAGPFVARGFTLSLSGPSNTPLRLDNGFAATATGYWARRFEADAQGRLVSVSAQDVADWDGLRILNGPEVREIGADLLARAAAAWGEGSVERLLETLERSGAESPGSDGAPIKTLRLSRGGESYRLALTRGGRRLELELRERSEEEPADGIVATRQVWSLRSDLDGKASELSHSLHRRTTLARDGAPRPEDQAQFDAAALAYARGLAR